MPRLIYVDMHLRLLCAMLELCLSTLEQDRGGDRRADRCNEEES